MKHSSSDRIRVTVALLLAIGASLVAASNSVTISDTSGSGQNNRPFTISRVFVQGEFPTGQYPMARVNGSATLATQVDVKNTWSDGSLKHALVSFIATVPANGSITVDFVKQASPNNAGFLNQAAMLAYGAGTWDAQIQTSVGTTSARTMLQNLAVSLNYNSNQVRYWLQGPIVTQVIVEDRSPALAYDFGTDANKCLHPIFVLTFYPGASVGIKVEYIVENVWLTKFEDQNYALTLTANGSNVFTKPTFDFIAGSRWRKVFWMGASPTGWTDETAPGINIDYNLPYLIASNALPNYDTTRVVTASDVTSEASDFAGKAGADEPQFCVTNQNNCASYVLDMTQTGGRGDIGYIERWFVRYLYTFSPSLYKMFIQDTLVSGRIPIHMRDTNSALFFDSAHTATALGRPVSLSANPTINGPTSVGPVTRAGWNVDQAHQPALAYTGYLLLGDWYLLDELYFFASWEPLGINTCVDAHWCRHQDWGFLSTTIEIRGVAWGTRGLAHAAFMAPDNTPEQAYYKGLVNNQIQIWEGTYNISNGSFPPANPACPNFNVYTSTDKWCWGRMLISTRTGNGAPNPLGFPDQGDFYAPQDANNVLDPTKTGTTPIGHPWEANLVQLVYGHIKELGFGISAVQQYWAAWNINQVLDPNSNPYHQGDYVYPLVQVNNGAYFNNWTAWSAAYLPSYNVVSAFTTRVSDLEFGYPNIAYAALSYTAGLTAGAFKGNDAWSWISATIGREGNDNPKWAIVPRVAVPVQPPTCDVNGDGVVNNLDVQIETNRALGLGACGNGDLTGNGTCTVIDVQRIINAALGGSCRIGP